MAKDRLSVRLQPVRTGIRGDARLTIRLGKIESWPAGVEKWEDWKLQGRLIVVSIGDWDNRIENAGGKTITVHCECPDEGQCSGEEADLVIAVDNDFDKLCGMIEERTSNTALNPAYYVYRKNQGDSHDEAKARADEAYPLK